MFLCILSISSCYYYIYETHKSRKAAVGQVEGEEAGGARWSLKGEAMSTSHTGSPELMEATTSSAHPHTGHWKRPCGAFRTFVIKTANDVLFFPTFSSSSPSLNIPRSSFPMRILTVIWVLFFCLCCFLILHRFIISRLLHDGDLLMLWCCRWLGVHQSEWQLESSTAWVINRQPIMERKHITLFHMSAFMSECIGFRIITCVNESKIFPNLQCTQTQFPPFCF